MTRHDLRRFAAGTHWRLQDKLGAHTETVDGEAGISFSIWAPNARRVSLIGDFNGWTPDRQILEPWGDSGIWSIHVPGLTAGALYKYRVQSRQGASADKADPFAVRSQSPSQTASIVWGVDYSWRDDRWLASRHRRHATTQPMTIYELHVGSWRRGPEGRLPGYRELAAELVPYLREMGFTHVELMPVTEHPYYGSWGYQTTGYFSATGRYGSPQDLMYLIDELHRGEIGVILDWVPSHFPADEHGLAFFDGTHLFEHADPRLGFHPDWKSWIFNYGRGPVRSFLISSAMFWVERYHVDALRVDAVASMLYRNYSRPDGEWIPNKFGGRENLEAIAFLRQLNDTVHRRSPGVLTIAEESTTWPMVSRPTHLGGLGFDMKWDLGWMHDTLAYFAENPVHRRFHHQKLTFRQLYAFSENFVLPLSHDEVVHGKGSLAAKMYGDTWQRFANLRALYGYMYSQSGKKLLFMGSELGPWTEWDHERGLDWSLVDHAHHAGLRRWVADLNRVYRDEPALHELDFSPRGFRWIDCSDSEQSVIAMTRHGGAGESAAVVMIVCNFTPVPRAQYRVGAPRPGRWRELLNSDALQYGGSGTGNLGQSEAVAMRYHDQPYSLCLTLPPLSAIFLRCG